ncbi:MAG: hypothetical protein IH786_12805 [Proteobacteria bacterium]|nr:hypothetical protein [Pseudomonadota bacterium]
MRSTNPEFKGEFPEDVVRAYATSILGPQDDALVLGHFHVERELACAGSKAYDRPCRQGNVINGGMWNRLSWRRSCRSPIIWRRPVEASRLVRA